MEHHRDSFQTQRLCDCVYTLSFYSIIHNNNIIAVNAGVRGGSGGSYYNIIIGSRT